MYLKLFSQLRTTIRNYTTKEIYIGNIGDKVTRLDFEKLISEDLDLGIIESYFSPSNLNEIQTYAHLIVKDQYVSMVIDKYNKMTFNSRQLVCNKVEKDEQNQKKEIKSTINTKELTTINVNNQPPVHEYATKRLYVGNLDYRCTKAYFAEYFQDEINKGVIQSYSIHRPNKQGTNYPFAFVFVLIEEFTAFIRKYNRREFGKRLLVVSTTHKKQSDI